MELSVGQDLVELVLAMELAGSLAASKWAARLMAPTGLMLDVDEQR